MKRISSEFTPVVKYVIPWTIILVLLFGIIAAFAGGQFYLALAIIFIGTPIVGFIRTMLMSLKHVFLDKKNKLLIVHGGVEELIPYADVKEILRPWTPPYLVTVSLNKNYSFGATFVFVPNEHPLFWDEYDEDLKAKVRC